MNEVKCNNCMKVFEEDEIVYDSDDDMEYCPYCGDGGCLMDLEDEDEKNNFIQIVGEISKAIDDGFVQTDPNNQNNILIYRLAGKTEPEGWYSENILTVASELANNKDAYNSFKQELSNAKEEK